MFIKSLTLKGYKRFALKDIKEYTFEPKSNLSIFNWGNGVGKSSLLAQLNPLPANIKKDFNPEGYKSITIEHLGKEYILKSEGSKHSFLEDNEELNPGGTRKAQLELVKEKFKLDPNNIRVINGNNEFSNMTPSERKSWLTKISTVDYVYPITIYNKILEQRRDNSGVIKNAKEQIAIIEKTLEEAGSIEEIEKEKTILQEVIKDLLKSYELIPKPEDKDTLISTLKDLVNRVYREELLNVNVDIFKIEEELAKYKTLIENNHKEEIKIEEELKKLNETVDPKSLLRLKEDIENKSKLLTGYPFAKNEDTLNIVEKMTIDLYTSLSNIKSKREEIKQRYLDINIEEKYSLDTIENKLTVGIEGLRKVEVRLETINYRTNALTNIENISLTCDKCNNIMEVKSIKENLTTEKNKLLESKTKLVNYLKHWEYIKKLETSSIELDKQEELLISNNQIYKAIVLKENANNNTTLSIEILHRFLTELKDVYTPIVKELSILDKKYQEESIRMNMETDLRVKQMEVLTSKRDILRKDKEEFTSKYSFNLNLKTKFVTLTSIRENIKSILKRLSIVKARYRDIRLNEIRDMLIKDLDIRSKELDKILETRSDLEKQLKMHYNTIKDKESDNEILNVLINSLSPSNGLIAKSINSFIGKFISDINLLVNTVWSYPMRLLPCEVSEDSDLDYKFKVEVDNKFIIDDISELSSSMKEIIDLCFRLIFIKYMDFGGLPIILDEFGRTMDQEHRIHSFNMIDEVICNTYDQVFLVSHFEEMYGRFKNADFPKIGE